MPITFLGWLAIMVVSFLLNKVLAPKIKGPKTSPFESPICEEGVPIPFFYGIAEMAPNTTWCGDIVKKKVGDFTQYRANMQNVIGWGVVNEIRDISFDGKSCRNHHLTAGAEITQGGVVQTAAGLFQTWQSGGISTPVIPGAFLDPATGLPTRFFIDGCQHEESDTSPAMFGGKKSGGGPAGWTDFYWGYDGQPVNVLLQQKFGATMCSAYPKLCYHMVGTESYNFHQTWNTATPYPIRYLLRRNAWYTTYPSPLGQTKAEMESFGVDANAAEIIYDICVNQLYALGVSASLIDVPSFSQCAASLRTEVISATKTGFGVSMIVSSAQEAGTALGDLLQHIDAVVAADPLTGKLKMKLIRNDYTIANLMTVSTANASNLKVGRSSWRETVNEVRIKYKRIVENNEKRGFVAAAALAQDLGNRYATGSTRSQTIEMPFITDADTAALVAARQLRRLAYPLARLSWNMNRQGYSLMPGDVVKLTWTPLGITDLVVRVLEINYGTLDNPEMEIIGTEDIFNVSSTSYTAPPSSVWTEADSNLQTGYGLGYGYDYGGTIVA